VEEDGKEEVQSDPVSAKHTNSSLRIPDLEFETRAVALKGSVRGPPLGRTAEGSGSLFPCDFLKLR